MVFGCSEGLLEKKEEELRRLWVDVSQGLLVVWFLENPIYTRTWFVLQCVGILLGGVSDCEELVGVTHRGMMEIIQIKDSSKVPKQLTVFICSDVNWEMAIRVNDWENWSAQFENLCICKVVVNPPLWGCPHPNQVFVGNGFSRSWKIDEDKPKGC